MKKNRIALAIILIILVMTLVACGNTNDATDKSDKDEYFVTIHPNNGDPNVKWDISDPIPKFEKEGFEIEGYYLDSDFTIEVALTSLKITGLNGNIDVYVKWKKEECEHDIVIDDAVPATCTEKGLTEGKHCSKCDEVILAQTEVPALGHTSADAVKENEIVPTCTTAGSYDSVVYCSVCDAELSREAKSVDALDHNIVNHQAQAPTCTEVGWEAYETCSRCDHTTYAEIPAINHTYDNTCDTTCNECGAVRTIDHTYDNTCDTICNICEDVRTIEHTYSSDCDIICNVCEHKRLSSVNHTYSSDCDTICNDCGATRITTTAHSDVNPADNSCDVCGEKVSSLTFRLSGDGQSYDITGANANISGDITLPSTYNGKPVTRIGRAAFYICDSLTSITIPDSVTTIGDYAFQGCTSLTSIFIPDSVTRIGDNAFYICISLTSISVDENNPKYKSIDGNLYSKDGKTLIQYAMGKTATSFVISDSVTSIGDCAFYFCTRLTSVTIGSGVTTIGYGAFYNCTSLTSVTIGNSVTSIGYSAFSGCTSLTYNVYDNGKYLGNESNPYLVLVEATSTSITSCEINENCRVIYGGAFEDCTSLTSIVIPDSVTAIGSSAFYKCSSLTDVYYTGDIAGWCGISFGSSYANPMCYADNLYIDGKLVEGELVISDSVTSIGSSAFSDCTSLTSVVIPDSVTSIGSFAFYNCTSLTSVTFGENSQFTTIGEDAFQGCTGLTSIVIPDSVTTIGLYAFRDCTSLTSITFEDPNGWYLTKAEGATSGTDLALTNTSTTATYLTSTYCDYYWYKK